MWWCDEEENLYMGTYIWIPGAGVEYLWRVFHNEEGSSFSSSAGDKNSCGGIEILWGNAKLESVLTDGVIVFKLPKSAGILIYSDLIKQIVIRI